MYSIFCCLTGKPQGSSQKQFLNYFTLLLYDSKKKCVCNLSNFIIFKTKIHFFD